MSKLTALIFVVITGVSLSGKTPVFASPPPIQDALVATISIEPPSQSIGETTRAHVSGIFVPGTRNFSMTNSVASASRLAGRISELDLVGSEGRRLSFRELVPGEYLADQEIRSWSFTVDLAPSRGMPAHSSWVAGDIGILMLRDLLPGNLNTPHLYVRLKLPFGWLARSIDVRGDELKGMESTTFPTYEIRASADSVVLIGKGWRDVSTTPAARVLIAGTFAFEDKQATSMVDELLSKYQTLFAAKLRENVQVGISKFPYQTNIGEWQAETLGSNVTIITSDMPFKAQSVQRLHEQLRHELFHLWIPNDVSLTGKYDWFYEGFALYQSLKLAVSLNRIRFDDFLDTLSRAHTIDSANTQRQSLIQASANRFSGANTQVYARGMLVAFLTDLELLHRSKGKRSVEDILRQLYTKHRKPVAPIDGNAAVTELFRSNPGLDQIINKFVAGTESIDWNQQLAAAGISDTDPGPVTMLKVNEKLNGRQKTLLDKLGYNSWRKLSPSSK